MEWCVVVLVASKVLLGEGRGCGFEGKCYSVFEVVVGEVGSVGVGDSRGGGRNTGE